MSDFLLQLGGNRNARKLVKTLGLPIPLPQALRRATGPWEERPLADQTVVLGGAAARRRALGWAPCWRRRWSPPAPTRTWSGDDARPAFRELGEAYGRPPRTLDPAALPERLKADALVFDASALETPADLRALYDFFHPLLAGAGAERPGGGAGPPGARRRPIRCRRRRGAALDGFVRSLAKEIGKRGATAQLVLVEPGAEKRLAAGAALPAVARARPSSPASPSPSTAWWRATASRRWCGRWRARWRW